MWEGWLTDDTIQLAMVRGSHEANCPAPILELHEFGQMLRIWCYGCQSTLLCSVLEQVYNG